MEDISISILVELLTISKEEFQKCFEQRKIHKNNWIGFQGEYWLFTSPIKCVLANSQKITFWSTFLNSKSINEEWNEPSLADDSQLEGQEQLSTRYIHYSQSTPICWHKHTYIHLCRHLPFPYHDYVMLRITSK